MHAKTLLMMSLSTALLFGCKQATDTPTQADASSKPATTAQAQTSNQDLEASLRKAMLLPDDAKITYQDENGVPISLQTFMTAMTQEHRSFDKDQAVNDGKMLVVLKLNPAKANASAKTSTAPPTLSVAVGSAMPALPSPDLGGHAHTLADGTHYTLLSFYFAKCVPCIEEVPAINALSAQGSQLQVVSVTPDSQHDADGFIKQRGLQAPVVAEANGYADKLGIHTYPTLVLVAPDGKLLGTRSGGSAESVDDIKQWLTSLGAKV